MNPDTQHYIITRQNTCRLYTTPKKREVVYIASPKQCSGGVLMQFLEIVSYTTFIAQLIHEDPCLSQSFIPEYTWSV